MTLLQGSSHIWPAARSPQPAARNLQPATRSPQNSQFDPKAPVDFPTQERTDSLLTLCWTADADYIQPAFILTSISDNQMLLFTYLILHSRHVHLLLQGCFFLFLFFSEIAILHEPSATSDLGIHCLLRTLALCFIEPMEIQALQACGYYYYYYYFFFFLLDI